MSEYTPAVTGTGAKARVQRVGAFLAGMVMPNLGAFIAFGLITSLFLDTGWINLVTGHVVEAKAVDPLPFTVQIASVIGPLINVLIPILIGYTGGKMVHGTRGGVVGSVATVGAMMAPVALQLIATGKTEAPQNISEISSAILAALIIGPLAALVMKLWDNFIAGKVKGGFEMLVDNFSAGIVGGIFAIIGIYVVGPITFFISQALGQAVSWLVGANVLPLVSIIIEPAKVLFLNNALNHGVLTPLGSEQAAEAGKSIMFMLESNPGPGLGILTAMLLFGPRAIRPTVPAAMVVQFLGGIHEIYFPYVLLKPILIVAAILGGATGVLWESIWGLGLVAPASPGSIFAWIAVSPPDNLLLNMVGIVLSAAVAAIVGAVVLGFGRKESAVDDAIDLEAAKEQTAARKAESKGQAAPQA